ncbi:hypothetical protein C7M84_004624 [Penaeus vannamei]|uniref:Uncharacterized protein n=1 Tax=Penaeus vannamei TaxID=6689 RepID=A0A423TK36_PENVA|nr:hypothetical protein C7M84_004624 [Penaeus vannamei]
MKLPQDATATLKLATETLSSTDSLTTVTLSGGEGLVAPALANNSHTATNALTTTSFSGGVRLTAPSLSTNGNLAITSLTSAAATSTIPTTSTPTDNFARSTIANSDTITAAAIPAVDSNTHNQVSPMNMNQIVTTSGDGVIDGNLVTSSSIDAVVTTMVAPSDCPNVASNCRKVPQVIVKLLSDDSLSLDMVRIIAEQETDNTSHNAHGFNMLTRTGTLVHTKLSESSIINAVAPNQYRQTEVIRPAIRDEGDVSPECSVVWTCAYCSLAFSSSEAVGQHQEKDCTENPNNVVFATTTSQSTVDALMSPLRESEDPSYDLKLEQGDSQPDDAMKDAQDEQKVQEKNVESPDCETTWNCAGRWNKDVVDTKLEEEMADNPGDTPPQTPPLEVTVKKRKRKPGPKAKPREKNQLLPTDLESASLSGSVTTKDGIFISSDPLAIPALIPIRGTGENGVNCSYGVALTTPAGGPGVTPTVDHATYIMINNPDEEVAPNAVPSTHGLNIMYTADPAQAPSQQVGEVDGTSLDQIEHLSSSVGPSLVSSNGQLHHRLNNQGQIDQGQDAQTIITEENVLEEGHRQELKFSTGSGESGTELRADGTHNPSTAPSPSDPGPGFHLELLSQTIQLELQRSQTSTGFIG